MNFYMFKSISGDWVCGELTEETETEFYLKRPRILSLFPVGEPQSFSYAAQLIPYNMLDPDAVVGFNPDYVVAYWPEPSREFINKYISSTTNIEIVTAH